MWARPEWAARQGSQRVWFKAERSPAGRRTSMKMKKEVTNMAIVRWEPFRELLSSQDKFNRLFTEMFPRFFEEGEGPMTTWAPAVDIVETDHDLTIKAELPGMDPKDIEARVEGGALYLKGERKFENETNKGNYHRV